MAVALGDELETQDTILGEVHVGRENAGVAAVQLLTGKVLLQGTLTVLVVLQSDVAVSGEGTGQDGNEAEGGFERLVENVTHLVLKVLSGDERVDQVLAARAQHGLDLTAGAGAHGLEIEGLPQMVDGATTGLGTSIDEHADIGIQNATKGLEEPTMRVDLLLVLFLETEQHLNGLLLGDELDDIVLDGHADLGRVLVNMRRDILSVNLLLGNTLLIDTHTGQQRSCSRVDLGTTVTDDAHHNLLPGVLAPGLAFRPLAHVLDVLEHTNHGARKQNLVLVVHGYDNEELCVPRLAEELLAQSEVLLVELGRVAGGSRVSHMGELVALAVGELV